MDESVQKQLELDDASKLLLKAAALIESKGLCKGQYTERDRYCVFGALDASAGFFPGDGVFASCSALDEAILRFGDAVGSIAGWNDDHTKEEVVAKLRSVALGG